MEIVAAMNPLFYKDQPVLHVRSRLENKKQWNQSGGFWNDTCSLCWFRAHPARGQAFYTSFHLILTLNVINTHVTQVEGGNWATVGSVSWGVTTGKCRAMSKRVWLQHLKAFLFPHSGFSGKHILGLSLGSGNWDRKKEQSEWYFQGDYRWGQDQSKNN